MITNWKASFWSSEIGICWVGVGVVVAVVSCLSCHSGWSAIRHSCIAFELLGATVGLTSFAACGPGRFHFILDLPSAFVGDPRSSPRESKCTGEWENPTALRSALEGELREGSCCSACRASTSRPAQQWATLPGGRQLQQSGLCSLWAQNSQLKQAVDHMCPGMSCWAQHSTDHGLGASTGILRNLTLPQRQIRTTDHSPVLPKLLCTQLSVPCLSWPSPNRHHSTCPVSLSCICSSFGPPFKVAPGYSTQDTEKDQMDFFSSNGCRTGEVTVTLHFPTGFELQVCPLARMPIDYSQVCLF